MRSDNIPPQIPPLRIITLNQFHLPRPPPLLNLLFPRNRRRQIRAQLKINQPINIIFLRKLTPPFALFMLPNPRRQIRRHSRVKRAVWLVGYDVDGGGFHFGIVTPDGDDADVVTSGTVTGGTETPQ